MPVANINAQKSEARRKAFAARKEARNDGKSAIASACLVSHIETIPHAKVISGYMAIQTEIDPITAMNALHEKGYQICVPVIQGRGQPLLFREWTPDSAMIEGDFGALIPRSGDFVIPDLCIVPLVAFDNEGHRLGYGGGYYDRTLVALRESGKSVHAVGFAFGAQSVPVVPFDANDQTLDSIVTEDGVQTF